METPSFQKATNKGVFKAYDVPSSSLTVTVPQFDPDSGTKVQLDINYNVEYLAKRQVELEAEITEKRKEKNQIIALIEKFKTDIETAKADAPVEDKAPETTEVPEMIKVMDETKETI